MPLANDLLYGGKYIHNGDKSEFSESLFEGYYENKEGMTGDRMFLMLWLHAYKYTHKDIVVRTKRPEWSLPDFVIKDALAHSDWLINLI